MQMLLLCSKGTTYERGSYKQECILISRAIEMIHTTKHGHTIFQNLGMPCLICSEKIMLWQPIKCRSCWTDWTFFFYPATVAIACVHHSVSMSMEMGTKKLYLLQETMEPKIVQIDSVILAWSNRHDVPATTSWSSLSTNKESTKAHS